MQRDPEAKRRREITVRAALKRLDVYLSDPTVQEIMLNPDGSLWVERAGAAPQPTDTHIAPLEAEHMLRQVAAEVRVELNAIKPAMLCRLPFYGDRLQALMPPIVAAPTFAMRRPAKEVFSLQQYADQGVLNAHQLETLRRAVHDRLNILIGGSTGSGKTTLLNAVANELSGTDDRVITVEDYPELQCTVRNKVPLLIDPPEYTWRHAIINSMRLRPDRIFLAEVVDGAALDLFKAMGTGHPGSLATIHADSATLMLERFCQLMEEVVQRAPRESVAATIHMCLHMKRDRSHPSGRAVTGLVRVRGYDRVQRKWLVEEL